MELQHQHNAYVLPSNATPHAALYPELGSPSRVLQEACGNRQQDGYVDAHQHYQLSPPKLSPHKEDAENKFRPPAGHAQYQNHVVRSYYHEEEWKKKETEKLWRRLSNCPGYKRYRSRQSTKGGGDREQKWPEHMDRAFCAALVEHPPVGRKKRTVGEDTTLLGRNQLVATCLEKLTGVNRHRKQVSSHIQVLKPWVKHDPFVVHYLKMPEDRERVNHRSRSVLSKGTGGISAISSHNAARPQQSHLSSQIDELSLPYATGLVIDPDDNDGDQSYWPMLFDMHVADKRRQPPSIIHRFTEFARSSRKQDCSLTEECCSFDGEMPWSWRRCFPPLASVHDSGTLTSRVVFCHAKIALLPQAIPEGAELQILLHIDTPPYVASSDGLHSYTSFFNDGTFIEKCDKEVRPVEEHYTRCQVAFGSKFWAAKISEWQKVLRHPDLAKRAQAEAEVGKALSRLSAVQEVSFESPHTGQSQLLLLMCWKFELVRAGGSTTWRNVSIHDDVPQSAAKVDGKAELLLTTPVQHVVAGYSHEEASDPHTFDDAAFELSDLAHVAIPGLTHDLHHAVEGAEAFDVDGMDFDAGHITIDMGNDLPLEAYADTTPGYEQFSQAPSIALGAEWESHYSNVFEEGHYNPDAFEPVSAEQVQNHDNIMGSQRFHPSPLVQMRIMPEGVPHS